MNDQVVQPQGGFVPELNNIANAVAGDAAIRRTQQVQHVVKDFKRIATKVLDKSKETSTFSFFYCLAVDSVVRGDKVDVLLLFNREVKNKSFMKKCGQNLRYKYSTIDQRERPSVIESEKELTIGKPFLAVTFLIGDQQIRHLPLAINDAASLKYNRATMGLSLVGDSSFRLLRYFKNLRVKPWSLVDDWTLKLLTHMMSQVQGDTMGCVMARMINFFLLVADENQVQDLISGEWINVVKPEDLHHSNVKSQAYLDDANLFQLEHIKKGPVPYPGDPDQLPQALQVAQAHQVAQVHQVAQAIPGD